MGRPQVFRGSWLWIVNSFAGVVTGFVGVTIFFAIDIRILLAGRNPADAWKVFGFWGAGVILTALAYFPGNLGIYWPYAVGVDPDVCVKLYGPFKKVSIPISEIGEITDSFFWQGYVVRLRKPHGALIQFVIPWYFGYQRKELARALQVVVRQRDE